MFEIVSEPKKEFLICKHGLIIRHIDHTFTDYINSIYRPKDHGQI